MKRLVQLFSFGLILSVSPIAKAADGSSGCGPAWYVLKQNSLLSSFGRSITNGMLSPFVTLGMTFGTSNCAKHSIVLLEKQTRHYLAVNYEQVKAGIAQGQSAYLSGFINTLSCQGEPEQIQGRVAETLRSNYREIYKDESNSGEVLSALYGVIENANIPCGLDFTG